VAVAKTKDDSKITTELAKKINYDLEISTEKNEKRDSFVVNIRSEIIVDSKTAKQVQDHSYFGYNRPVKKVKLYLCLTNYALHHEDV
jgi:hypothetical protein